METMLVYFTLRDKDSIPRGLNPCKGKSASVISRRCVNGKVYLLVLWDVSNNILSLGGLSEYI